AVARVGKLRSADVLRVETTLRVHLRKCLASVGREIEAVVRGATAPRAIGDDHLPACVRLEGNVVADVVVRRLKIRTAGAVHDRIGNRIEHACPRAAAAAGAMLPYAAGRRRVDAAGPVELEAVDE